MENEIGAIYEACRWASDGHVWRAACFPGILTQVISVASLARHFRSVATHSARVLFVNFTKKDRRSRHNYIYGEVRSGKAPTWKRTERPIIRPTEESNTR